MRERIVGGLRHWPEPKAQSRHGAITHDLYSYRLYKHWMNNLRASWDKS
jgi:hypothetical protein